MKLSMSFELLTGVQLFIVVSFLLAYVVSIVMAPCSFFSLSVSVSLVSLLLLWGVGKKKKKKHQQLCLADPSFAVLVYFICFILIFFISFLLCILGSVFFTLSFFFLVIYYVIFLRFSFFLLYKIKPKPTCAR